MTPRKSEKMAKMYFPQKKAPIEQKNAKKSKKKSKKNAKNEKFRKSAEKTTQKLLKNYSNFAFFSVFFKKILLPFFLSKTHRKNHAKHKDF